MIVECCMWLFRIMLVVVLNLNDDLSAWRGRDLIVSPVNDALNCYLIFLIHVLLLSDHITTYTSKSLLLLIERGIVAGMRGD